MSVQLPDNTPRENTSEGAPQRTLYSLATAPDGESKHLTIKLDAANEVISIQQIKSNGSPEDLDHQQIVIAIDDLDGAAAAAIAKFRQFSFCDEAGNQKTAWVLSTEPEAP